MSYKPFKMKGHTLPGIRQRSHDTQSGKSPYQKELVGNQKNLPEELKAKIEAAPAKQKKQIYGEQTFEAEKNKNKDQFELGLSLDGGSADPMDTKDRLIIKKSDNQKNNMGKPLSEGDFIEQLEKMTIKKDSVGGSGNTYYSLDKPKKSSNKMTSPARQKKHRVYHEMREAPKIERRELSKEELMVGRYPDRIPGVDYSKKKTKVGKFLSKITKGKKKK